MSRSEAFENPVIQKHYRNLEALALDMMAPEDTEDLISKIQTRHLRFVLCLSPSLCFFCHSSHLFLSSVPKVEQMDQRLGDLALDFKDLVYPAHYNPEGKPAPKRKTGEGSLR